MNLDSDDENDCGVYLMMLGWRSFFFCFLVWVSAQAGWASGSNICQVHMQRVFGHWVWHCVSVQSYERHQELLLPFRLRASLLGMRGGLLPAYDEQKIIRGQKWLLSLGEGGSNYVATLLSMQQDLFPLVWKTDNIHAVDIAYKDLWTFLENDPEQGEKFDLISDYLIGFHGHYHGALFQTMDLRQPNGDKMKFDEIIAVFSLGFMISSQAPMREESLLVLRNVLGHLKSGGVLRIVGGHLKESDGEIKVEGSYHRYGPLFEQLAEEGLIKDYSNPAVGWISIQVP